MLRKLLHSVAFVVFVSAPGLADINQSQGFAVGLSSAIDLLGGMATADDSKFLAVQLDQAMTQGSGLLTPGNTSAFGQQSLSLTSGSSLIAASFGSIAGGLQVPGSVIAPLNGEQLSLFNSLPLVIAIRP